MILLIDTSQQTATIALSNEGRVICVEENAVRNDSAAWLHPAINRLLEKAASQIRQLEAVAVVAGPGSYTGLRVGMAAAKGFCYALKIPLITQNTLRVMAESMKTIARAKNALICPMIDARRSEVFMALYKVEPVNSQPVTVDGKESMINSQSDIFEILPPQALILDKNSFDKPLAENQILFFGSGAAKWKEISTASTAVFETQKISIQAFADLATLDFVAKKYADLVYTEPIYLKEFFSY